MTTTQPIIHQLSDIMTNGAVILLLTVVLVGCCSLALCSAEHYSCSESASTGAIRCERRDKTGQPLSCQFDCAKLQIGELNGASPMFVCPAESVLVDHGFLKDGNCVTESDASRMSVEFQDFLYKNLVERCTALGCSVATRGHNSMEPPDSAGTAKETAGMRPTTSDAVRKEVEHAVKQGQGREELKQDRDKDAVKQGQDRKPVKQRQDRDSMKQKASPKQKSLNKGKETRSKQVPNKETKGKHTLYKEVKSNGKQTSKKGKKVEYTLDDSDNNNDSDNDDDDDDLYMPTPSAPNMQHKIVKRHKEFVITEEEDADSSTKTAAKQPRTKKDSKKTAKPNGNKRLQRKLEEELRVRKETMERQKKELKQLQKKLEKTKRTVRDEL